MRIIGNDPSTPRQAQIVASGTLSTGDAVVVNSDGTVSVVEGSDASAGAPVVFESAQSNTSISAVYDSDAQKVVIAYRDEGPDYGTAIVGTVSGTSISFGTPVVFNYATTLNISAAYDANAQKIVIAYSNYGNSRNGTAIVGTVSGTSISFGAAVEFKSSDSFLMSTIYDANAQKVVISYQDSANATRGTAVVGTVSGTSISFGTAVVFETGSTTLISSTYDANAQKVVIAYKDAGNSNYGTAIVGTVSGTSISFGSPVVFQSATSNDISATYDSNASKVVIAYRNGGNSFYGTAIVGTVSGTSISFGSSVVFKSANTSSISITFDSGSNKVVIAYSDSSNSNYGTAIVGTVSGTSISFDSPIVFSSSSTTRTSSTYDSNAQKVVIAYSDVGNSSYGTSVVFQTPSTNLTSENYIGTAASGAADTQRAKINLKGAVDENQSGLTAGQSYYVQTDGTLGTTPADPSVFAGTAVAATKLIVKG